MGEKLFMDQASSESKIGSNGQFCNCKSKTTPNLEKTKLGTKL